VYDPIYLGKVPYNLERFTLDDDMIKTFDIVVILVNHSSIDWNKVVQNSKCLIDTQNVTKDINGQHIIRI